jgi:reductive dehalogenase
LELPLLDEALLPYEKKLQAQERLRSFLGVRSVAHPTYEQYITGPIEQFEWRRNALYSLDPSNPFGEEFRQRFLARTGYETFEEPLPYSELDAEDRIGQSLEQAGMRLAYEYEPEGLPITPPAGRLEVSDRAWMTRLIKKMGLLLGAEMVRVARLDQRWVYKDMDVPHEYAIVLVVRHIRSLNNTAPSHLSGVGVWDTYSRLKVISTQLSDFIRGLGYDAVYRETLSDNQPEMLLIPIAIDAGVGEYSRVGRVLSPEFGTNMRMKAVTTDLPLQADDPISFGVHEFCMVCDNCARCCPPRAIPFGPPTEEHPNPGSHYSPGYKKWYVDAERCAMFWAASKATWTTCGGRCIAWCPWTMDLNPLNNMLRWAAIHSPARIKGLLARADMRLRQSRIKHTGLTKRHSAAGQD